MAQQRFTELRVGIFVVVCLALIAGLILKFGKYEKLAKKSYAVTVIFSDVGGIVRDADVLYGGISVGKVGNITLDQEGVLKVNVQLNLDQTVKIRKDAKFVINQSGLLGDRYIDVTPQSATAEFLKPGDTVDGTILPRRFMGSWTCCIKPGGLSSGLTRPSNASTRRC